VEQLYEELAGFLDNYDSTTFPALKDEFALIEESLDDLPDFLVCLTEAAGLPVELLDVLRRIPLTTTQLEAAMAGALG